MMRIPGFITARRLWARLARHRVRPAIQPLDRRDQQLLDSHRARLRARQMQGQQEARP